MKFLLPASASIVVVALVIGLESRSSFLASEPRDPAPHAKAMAGIFAPGRVEGASRELELRSALLGRVANIAVKEGDWVAKGHLLLHTDQGQYLAAVHLAEAQVRAAEAEHARLISGSHEQERRHAAGNHEAKVAQLQQAQRTWERFSQLSAGGAVTQQDTEFRQSELRVLEAEAAAAEAHVRLLDAAPRPDELAVCRANIEAAQARLEMAHCRLADTELRAAIEGQVLRIEVHEGEIVGPASPLPAVTLADTSQLRVRAFVDEYDATRIASGMPATITVDGIADREFRGRVTELSSIMRRKQLRTNQPDERLDADAREVFIALDGETGLMVGLRVDVAIGPPQDLPAEAGEPSASSAP